MEKKNLVVSGINLFEGGGLTVYKDFLTALINKKIDQKYMITAFVHDQKLFDGFSKKIELIELKDSRVHYYKRLFYEFIYFERYSRGKHIDIWVSLHDITPRVHADKLYTYCHNPMPFYKCEFKNYRYSHANFWFSLFYKYLYRINIKKNNAVIVQQDWMRAEFFKRYSLKNIVVARPILKAGAPKKISIIEIPEGDHEIFTFIFVSLPRFFKNFEVICQACTLLPKYLKYEVLLTIDGTENKYSKEIYNKYYRDPHIKWIGVKEKEYIMKLYAISDCMIFPSKLETWGLPVSEYKETGKPIILADLPYAHEAVGTYDKVKFFNPNAADALAEYMRQILMNSCKFDVCIEKVPSQPYVENWYELINYLV